MLYFFISEALLKIAILFFILIITCLLIFIIFYFIRRKARSKKRKKLREYFSNIISEIAICESVTEKLAGIEMQNGIAKPISLVSIQPVPPAKHFSGWLKSLKKNHLEKINEDDEKQKNNAAK